MTPAPQKEYIITEEQLSGLEKRGSGSPDCIGGYREDIATNVRSHPYNGSATSAELVLEASEKKYECTSPVGNTCWWSARPSPRTCTNMDGQACPGLKELRQRGEREQ